jgi:hypothetical protein
VSQTYQREKKEKYTAALSGFGAALLLTALMASNIGDLPASERSSAWRQFIVTAVIVGIPTTIWLWSLTPWDEVPPEKQKLGVAGILTAGAGGSTINFFLHEDPNLFRIFFGACLGFLIGAGLVFLAIGIFGRWRSRDETFTS